MYLIDAVLFVGGACLVLCTLSTHSTQPVICAYASLILLRQTDFVDYIIDTEHSQV